MTRNVRLLLIGLGLAAVVLAIFLPTDWYDQLPRSNEDLPEPPIKGVTLLRLCFALDGAILLLLCAAGCFRIDTNPADYLILPVVDRSNATDLRCPGVWVGAATVLAAALRFYHLGSDLWVDEICTVLNYHDMPTFHVVTSYTASNNHLLNTLLVKGMVNVAGMEEWAIRLPAVLAGIACIPATYYLARLALRRREAVLAAFLLAISYHHIFFSQNARGYSAMLLWSLLGTAFFLKAISTPQPRYWVLYVLTMFIAMATMLYAFFVVAGHCFALLGACWMLRRQKRRVLPLARTALVAWSVLGLLSLHLYATSLPNAFMYMRVVYGSGGDGFSLLSLEYLEEMRRGVAAGLGSGATIGAAVALVIAGAGFVAFLWQQPLYCLTLVAPLLATCIFVLSLNLVILPRSLLWALPVAMIFCAATAATLSRWLWACTLAATQRGRWLMAMTPVVLVSPIILLSVWSLPAYYRTPKQSNRASLEWVLQHKGANDVLVTVYAAECGPQFYGPPLGLRAGEDYLSVRTLEDLERVERENAGKTIWLMTTLHRGLSRKLPGLSRHIDERYRVRQSFPATIGDGDIRIWNNAGQ